MENKNDKKSSTTIKKFAALGVVAVLTMYGAQAVTVAGYNSITQSNHDNKMVALYNDIWKNIDKSNVDLQISEYKKLANSVPTELKMGALLPESTNIPLEVNIKLPNADNVEVAARELSDKTKIKISRINN